MKKQEYFDKLELELRRQNILKVQEILADYEEHFAMGISKGKSEEQIVDKLGDPVKVAKAYQAENLIQQIQDAPVQDQANFFMQALVRLIILTPINFFMLVGPVLIGFVAIGTVWLLALSLGGFGVGAFVRVFSFLPISTLGFWGAGAALFGTIAAISGCLLSILILFFITKSILQLFVSYLKWNVEFIKGTSK